MLVRSGLIIARIVRRLALEAAATASTSFTGLTEDQAAAFARRWLPAWTGNSPDTLASFYTDDLFYADPSVPEGLHGKAAFLDYMTVLLANNPAWEWTQTRSTPMRDGFVNHWRVRAPAGDTVV